MRFYYRDNARSTRRSKFSLDPNQHHDTTDTSSWNLATTLPVANDPSQIMLHSSCPQPQPQPVNGNTDSLLDALRALPNSDLWEDAECDDDGWWIEESINSGDLVCVSDGSYKPEKAPDVCSCAFRLICKRTKRKFQCTWVERRSEASIYRGEILGTVGYLIVLKVVATRSSSALIQGSTVQGIADNKGVITNSSDQSDATSEDESVSLRRPNPDDGPDNGTPNSD